MRSRLRLWAVAVAAPALAFGLAGMAPAASVADATMCAVEDATLTWGFKESFRSYVSGSIANGQWSVSDGAQYETPHFRFVDGTGLVDPSVTAGAVEFTGAITFIGHDGILNTTLANPVIELRQAGAALVVDVTGTTQAGETVDERAVDFVALDFDGATERDRSATGLTVTGVPATLTDAGAAAFGTYQAGEPFDPIDLQLVFETECPEPAGTGWLYWVAAALAGAAVVAVAVTLRSRRRAAPQ